MAADAATRDRKAALTKARKAKRSAANEGRRAANIAALGSAYNPRAEMIQMRWRRVYEGKTQVLKYVPVAVSLPPSKQLNRSLFEASK